MPSNIEKNSMLQHDRTTGFHNQSKLSIISCKGLPNQNPEAKFSESINDARIVLLGSL